MAPTTTSDDRPEICFFDLETTVPQRRGQGRAILEFGAILVCPKRLVELQSYSSLVRPDDLSSVSPAPLRCNGISRNDVASAPSFSEIAGKVHDLLHGRVWAGHNIVRFDCVRIREAFQKIGRPAPEPKGIIDSLALLTQRFGRRAGNMKMATLANYFEIGVQAHRSLDDVRMNLEVVKFCATVLFLESSLPDILTADGTGSAMSTRSSSNIKSSPKQPSLNMNNFSSLTSEIVPNQSPRNSENHPIISLLTHQPGEANADVFNPVHLDPFDIVVLRNETKTVAHQSDVTMEEKTQLESHEIDIAEGSSSYAEFLEPNEVSLSSINASLIPYYRGTHRIRLLHENIALQLFCPCLRVRFGVNGKFLDQAGRPRLSFVVDVSPGLCEILDACDNAAKTIFEECRSSSEWKSIVGRNDRYINNPTVRLNIPTVVNEDVARYAAEIHQKDSSGTVHKLVFSKSDAAELGNLFRAGIFVDAFFSLDTYDYQGMAGIRLVAKKLVIHSD
ncbi:NAC45/86-DEPENDENT EXONUCLEASE-DOMAIN PROTEIN 2 [Hibiscus trionum]|uniref:NAC45/86-DEPENDENT EXONUCLEASE-DOMAIN PROTEIN 2 n=1 Tax=Hibiscus trionum TaxID=183268 RepID=A0A9W7J3K1_HIBTR|nr:NAC45/86-DEPENDENT EXONUCLEASE-DOMAIN PROTEIN 2 [Hibiscus trionum]